MRRALELFGIAAAGYLLYQLLHEKHTHRSEPAAIKSSPVTEPAGAAITGAGEGMRETTEDGDGASMSHVVGRGVI
ncbi:MAG TPA: hypothetical protein VHS31_18995 [Tepidisphaeraceae bacterium]|jgi:hypothetical protein|nr:hypothetical protein [Tepidisphaeraceae bacterium]